MTHEERSQIKDLDKCDFGEIHAMHKAKVDTRKNMTKEEKLVRLVLFFFFCFPSLCSGSSVSVWFFFLLTRPDKWVRNLLAGSQFLLVNTNKFFPLVVKIKGKSHVRWCDVLCIFRTGTISVLKGEEKHWIPRSL